MLKTPAAQPRFGPVRVGLLFFIRESEALHGTQMSLAELREFLDRNMGVKIYRDMVRVKPYGTPNVPEGDWLRLGERRSRDPAGAGRASFKIVWSIGGCRLSNRETEILRLQTVPPEGLIQGDAFNELKAFILPSGCWRTITISGTERDRERPAPPSPSETAAARRPKGVGCQFARS